MVEVKAKALFNTLAVPLMETKANTLDHPSFDEKGEPLVKRLADTLTESESETLGDTQGDEEIKALVNALATTNGSGGCDSC